MTSRDRSARPGDARGRTGSSRPRSDARTGGPGRDLVSGNGPARVEGGRYRRFGVAVAVIAVVAAIVIVMTSRGSGSPEGEKTAPPEPTSTSLGAPRNCTANDLTVSVAAQKNSYVVGSPVVFAVTLSRVGSRPCLVDGSIKGTRVVITSAGNPVWSSADCASGEEMLLMGRGDEQRSTVRWNGLRSAAGCPRSQPAPGAGTFEVVAVVPGAGNLTSAPITIALTSPEPATSPTATATATDQPTAAPTTSAAPPAASTASASPTQPG